MLKKIAIMLVVALIIGACSDDAVTTTTISSTTTTTVADTTTTSRLPPTTTSSTTTTTMAPSTTTSSTTTTTIGQRAPAWGAESMKPGILLDLGEEVDYPRELVSSTGWGYAQAAIQIVESRTQFSEVLGEDEIIVEAVVGYSDQKVHLGTFSLGPLSADVRMVMLPGVRVPFDPSLSNPIALSIGVEDAGDFAESFLQEGRIFPIAYPVETTWFSSIEDCPGKDNVAACEFLVSALEYNRGVVAALKGETPESVWPEGIGFLNFFYIPSFYQ